MTLAGHEPISERFEDWLRRSLIEADYALEPEVTSRVLEQGAAAVAPLIRILEDRALLDLPEGGWAPLHAAALLGELRATEAIPALLAALADEEYGDLYTEDATESLKAMGPAALEPVLQAHATSSNRHYLMDLESILSSLDVEDDRIVTALLGALEREPEYAACCLALYGDERAIEPLRQAFDRCHLDAGVHEANLGAAGEIQAAIQMLGGSLSEEQERLYLHAFERWRAHVWPRAERRGATNKAKRKRKQQKASRKKNRR